MKKKIILSLFLFIITMSLSACTKNIEGYAGFYYPSGLAKDGFEVKEFNSVEECELWAQEKMSQATNSDAHYICGFNCTYNDDGQGCTTDEQLKE